MTSLTITYLADETAAANLTQLFLNPCPPILDAHRVTDEGFKGLGLQVKGQELSVTLDTGQGSRFKFKS